MSDALQICRIHQELGLAEIGYRIHCNRDFAMIAGFNDELELSRKQTIMQGEPCCDFRFSKNGRRAD
jgi:hypothetical protein